MGHENVAIIRRRQLEEFISCQATQVPSIHVEYIHINIFQAEFLDGPVQPLLHVVLRPAVWICKNSKILMSKDHPKLLSTANYKSSQ